MDDNKTQHGPDCICGMGIEPAVIASSSGIFTFTVQPYTNEMHGQAMAELAELIEGLKAIYALDLDEMKKAAGI